MAQDILSSLQKGEESAYKHLFHTYFPELVLYSAAMLKDRVAAEDLVQEFFIAFWTNKRYAVIETDLEGYLYRSIRNSSLNYLRDESRKKAREAEIEQEVFDSVPPDPTEYELERKDFYRAIYRLPLQRRRIFLLCTLQSMKYREVAELLGVSVNTVRTQMGRAFKSLREELRGRTFLTLVCIVVPVRTDAKRATA